MRIRKQILSALSAGLLLTAAGLSTYSCVEPIDTSNRYTFVGNTVASYLEEHEDLFSEFIEILKRGGRFNLMKAYGTYTCFAPTNQAIERYLFEQDSIYQASLLPGSKKVIWTGITSPRFEDLTDSMCVVIAQTHIIPKDYLTTEMEGDVVPTMNLNDRYLTMSYGTDSLQHSILYVNDAEVIQGDEEVENGVVHVISSVMNPSSETVPTVIESMKFLSIFSEALEVTGLELKLQPYKDFDYAYGDRTTLTIYNNPGCPYPANRYYGFTAFVEPDSVYHAAGIYTMNDLYQQCKIWYPEATDPDFKSENNALYKYIAYHLLDRKLLYSRLVCYKIVCGSYFNSESVYLSRADRYDYFETMQGTLLKVIMPRSNGTRGVCDDGTERAFSESILLNYSKDATNMSDPFNSTCGKNGINVNIRIANPTDVSSDKEKYPNYKSEALNGTVHLIDHLLVYDEDVMTGHVLNEIIRIDFSSMVPEYTNNNIRWCDGQGITWAPGSGDYEFAIPPGYSDRIKLNAAETRLYYLSPHNAWTNYMGDECMCLSSADISYRLPHVPAGTYEIRLGYQGMTNRGITQFYFDDEICGIPVDMRLDAQSNPRIGWVEDARTDDNGVINDKQMKNRGYLKGPTSFCVEYGTMTARESVACLRLVLTTKYFGPGEHWVRFSGRPQMQYMEMVPVGYLRRQDLSLEEKRK